MQHIRIILMAIALSVCAGLSAAAQTYSAPTPRRHFITVSVDRLYTQPLHFAKYPLQDLVGREVAAAQFEEFDYRTRDGAITIDVLEFSRRGTGASVTLFPFGSRTGPTLALRASFEDLPNIRIAFAGAGAPPAYALLDGHALDLAVALYVVDRSAGWGLGSHAFVGGGIGRVRDADRTGSRYFAEGGGGLSSGPIGIELAVKFAWNQLNEPVRHRFLTVPVTLRGTLSF
jgi:hypothetical protein